jgi:hypothetical protein
MTKTLKFIALASVATFALSACGGSTSTQSEPAPEVPEVTESVNVGFSPISGLPGGDGGPIAVVKIDNVNPARPQWGLSAADMVFVEEVEAGLTRIAAVYNSSMPNKVGPVRSARISDLEIMEQFGTPAFAYSGAQQKFLPLIDQANLINASHGLNGKFYTRQTDKNAPHNLTVDLGALVSSLTGISGAKDMGWTFSDVPATGGTTTNSFSAKWPASRVGAQWDGTNNAWVIALDNQPASDAVTNQPMFAKNIIVQYVEQLADSGFQDKSGNKTPLIESVGAGKAILMRDGQRFEANWSRPTAISPTTYTVGATNYVFAPGQTWVLFVPETYPVTFDPETSPTPGS